MPVLRNKRRLLLHTAVHGDQEQVQGPLADVRENPGVVRVGPKGSELVGRCGSEVQWYNAWEPAAKRAQAEKKLIIATAQFYSGFTLQALDYARIGPFMEPDIIELARERFIVMKLTKEADAPFKSGHVYGMGPSSFGVAVLFVTPDGKVVGDAFNFEQFYLYDYMLK